MKDPAILFYVQDFLIGSSLLTPLQKGHYITLLCYQQQSETGSLTIEEIQSLMRADFKKQWPTIAKKFKQDDHGYFNERMRREVERRKKHSAAQRENILKRWDKKGNTTVIPRYENGIGSVLPLETTTEIETVKRETSGTVTNAEEAILSNQIEFERICYTTNKPPQQAKVSLRKYHLHLAEKEQYPKSRKSVFSGFEKWLMNEKDLSIPNDKHRNF
jgi:hypothetical protein